MSWGSSFGVKKTGFGQTRGTTAPPQYQAVLKDDPLFTRLWNVRSAYNPGSKSYRFCFVFYNQKIPVGVFGIGKNFCNGYIRFNFFFS